MSYSMKRLFGGVGGVSEFLYFWYLFVESLVVCITFHETTSKEQALLFCFFLGVVGGKVENFLYMYFFHAF